MCACVIVSGQLSCFNPFAPGLDDRVSTGICPPLTTIEGVFCTFRNSYTFRDTILYSSLIAPEFAFVYRDYDNGVDVTWGRDQEMRTTYGLFQNVQNIMLTWNNVVAAEGTSENDSTIVRSFNLTVIFNPSSIERVDGRANFKLRRTANDADWKIVLWHDDSNF